MFCSSCGQSIPDASAFCPQCGRPTAIATPPGTATAGTVAPAIALAPAAAVPVAPGLVYAGFWLRFVAYIIDTVLLSAFELMLILILVAIFGLGGAIHTWSENPDVNSIFTATVILAIVLFAVSIFAIIWLYYACMESSRYQGTLGKMALGLIVTDLQVRRVSFARASGRFFAKIITGLIPLCIGYIMAGFTAKKQALHDMIASCLVLRKI